MEIFIQLKMLIFLNMKKKTNWNLQTLFSIVDLLSFVKKKSLSLECWLFGEVVCISLLLIVKIIVNFKEFFLFIKLINTIWWKFEWTIVEIELNRWVQLSEWNECQIVLRHVQTIQIWKWILKQTNKKLE
jgi:hypothetical protein